MGWQSFVYGRIIGKRYNYGGNIHLDNDRLLFHRLNKMIIDELPTEDEYPQITKLMFNTPTVKFGDGLYKDQVITFGASYKEVYDDWKDWLIKFENLLSKLYWNNAIVYLETENWDETQIFTWKNNNTSPFTGNENNTKDNWELGGHYPDFIKNDFKLR